MLIQDVVPAQKLRTNRKPKLKLKGRMITIISA
jgi:hypothetical protein